MSKSWTDIRKFSIPKLEAMIRDWKKYYDQIDRGFSPVSPRYSLSLDMLEKELDERKLAS